MTSGAALGVRPAIHQPQAGLKVAGGRGPPRRRQKSTSHTCYLPGPGGPRDHWGQAWWDTPGFFRLSCPCRGDKTYTMRDVLFLPGDRKGRGGGEGAERPRGRGATATGSWGCSLWGWAEGPAAKLQLGAHFPGSAHTVLMMQTGCTGASEALVGWYSG